MVIDSSALLAILLDEPERAAFGSAIAADDIRIASTASLLETSIVVLSRLGEPGAAELDTLLRIADIEAAAFSAEQLKLAIDAFRQYGKGRHPAALNFGDCFAYALARAKREPLLYKGDDFVHTDVRSAT